MSVAVQHSPYTAAALKLELDDLVATFESRIEELKSKIEVLEKEESKDIKGDEDENRPEVSSKDNIENAESGTDVDVGAAEESKQSNETIDATEMYKEAFNNSGGQEALNEFKNVSDNLHKQVVDSTIEMELDKLLPPSMPWNGASKFLVNQSYVQSIDELYEKAKRAHVIFETAVVKIATETTPNATPMVPRLKTKETAIDKAKFKYADEDGNGVAYYRLTDIVRATLVFDSIANMYKGIKVVQDCSAFEIVEFNDRFQQPIPNTGGYRDIQFTVKLKNGGFLCELQMSTEFMVEAKETFGHRDYEVYRRMKAALQNRDLEQVEKTLNFCKEQLGSHYKTKKILPRRCHKLVHDAAKMGDADILDRLIEYGADANTIDEDKNTPLHHAVFHGHERCVWLLLDKYKCDPSLQNKKDETALMAGYIKFYTQPSEQARRAIATLLQKTEMNDVLKTSTEFQNLVQSKLVNKRELVDSAADGDTDKMTEILREFADPNSERDGRTALEEAVNNGRTKAIIILLQFGATMPRKILQVPAETENYGIAKLLISNGANTSDVLPTPYTIPCPRLDERFKWDGIARCGKNLFCAPSNASCVLVINGETGEISTIPCGVEGGLKWSGIASYGTKLFCAPCCASSILVIDAKTKTTRTIPLEEAHIVSCKMDDSKWSGIARCGKKLFCAPNDAGCVLIIDGETEEISSIPCGVGGGRKWSGIASCGAKLFCAPSHSSSILVIDSKKMKIRTIPLRKRMSLGQKFKGIACYGTKLFCAPNEAREILVIDAKTESTRTIQYKVSGLTYQWRGIARYGKHLICTPFDTTDFLVIDGESEEIRTIPCGLQSTEEYSKKFDGIAQCGSKLFCAPCCASDVLVLEDRLVKLGLASPSPPHLLLEEDCSDEKDSNVH